MTTPEEFIAWTIGEFRANHGKVGGPFEGAPLLLLHTRGARTGLERVNPMMYLAEGPRFLVFASKKGSDRHPDWYYNLLAHPTSSIEIRDEQIDVTIEELRGNERDRMFEAQAGLFPGFAGYQRRTSRVIPVVALTPVLIPTSA
ncbi:MAG: nitroreductase family deazaflavin-dependent oxidoreductase [Nakamurella sp.]